MLLNLVSIEESIKTAIDGLREEFPLQVGVGGVNLRVEKGDTFAVSKKGNEVCITYANRVDIFVGIRYLLQTEGDFSLAPVRKIENLSVMCDCSRNAVMSVNSVKRFIRHLAVMGYNQLMLYTEDTYEVEAEPYFGHLRGRYTKTELKELNTYAALHGITLIPCIQTLAHMEGLRNWTAEYRKVFDCGNILLVGDERVYQMIDRMFATIRECFSTDIINVGMDEAWLLGAGQYLTRNGFEKRYDIMIKHLKRVLELAQKHGLKPFMWSDMFMRFVAKDGDYFGNDPISQEFYDGVPQGIHLIYWDYYHEDEAHYERMIDRHLGFNRELWFAGSSFTSYRFSADNERGLKSMIPAFNVCARKGISTFSVTQWGDDGGDGSMFSSLRTLMKMASLNYGESEAEYEKAFYVVSGGYTVQEFTALDFKNDRYLFYNDCFVGKYNTAIEKGYEKNYAVYAKNLAKPAAKKGKFQYLFAARKAYCEAMQLKCNLGNYTRSAYSSGKAAMKKAVKTYGTLLRRVEKFYQLFKAQWERDNKPVGFEIQTVRIGGMLQRLQDCIQRMKAYICGKVESIPELETPQLDVFGGKENIDWKLMEESVYYKDMVSVNFI